SPPAADPLAAAPQFQGVSEGQHQSQSSLSSHRSPSTALLGSALPLQSTTAAVGLATLSSSPCCTTTRPWAAGMPLPPAPGTHVLESASYTRASPSDAPLVSTSSRSPRDVAPPS